jgi:hypothetical protein
VFGTIIEPFRIKAVEPIRLSTREERTKLIAEAGFNVFALRSENVIIDLWVADAGFTSAANRAYLQRGGGHCVLAERLRSGSVEARAALARAGRYRRVAGNLEVKEVRLGDGARAQRFVVAHNPEAAARDRQVRENLIAYLESQIAGSDAWPRTRRDELVGALRTRPALYRLLRRTKEGKLRLDRAAVARDARLDGKWLLRSSDETLSAADLVVAYRQLYQVERGWRDLKGALRLRPVFHFREDRIRAHVQLCWLALLLIRVVESAMGESWRSVRDELERMHLVTLETSAGLIGAWSANLELRAPEKQSHVDPVEIVPEIKRRDLLGGLIHEYYSIAP